MQISNIIEKNVIRYNYLRSFSINYTCFLLSKKELTLINLKTLVA